ncbi:MAG: thiamine phosphate synthase [Betaproteobacteria bacterium]|nr:thiamine phosphate synthase [Betaproteobacteria bacterium]
MTSTGPHACGSSAARGAGPALYLITPQPEGADAAFLQGLRASLQGREPGSLLVQFRAQGLEPAHWRRLAAGVREICLEHGAPLLLGAGGLPGAGAGQRMRCACELGAQGLQLPSRLLAQPDWREACLGRPAGLLVSASCHDAAQLEAAAALRADFATVSPVLPTSSHPGAPGLGWARLGELCRGTRLPVYALGGLGPGHLALALDAGAAGVAAIRGLWERGGDAA